jgi:uncharacterized protein (TIGR03083 family)
MEHAQYVAAIRREGEDLAAAARDAGLDAVVPSCPEWTIADLLSHIGRVQHWVTSIVQTRAQPDHNWRMDDPPVPEARIVWFAEGCSALADALGTCAPSDEVWTWTPDHTIGFWSRRMAHEVAVHRTDAQGAAGTQAPIERELAVDGIQEFFDLIPVRPGSDVRGNGESIHLHCTDGEGEWLARLEPDGIVVTREHAKGDVAARGSASDLLLLVWGRDRPEVDVFGDATVLAKFLELARF